MTVPNDLGNFSILIKDVKRAFFSHGTKKAPLPPGNN